MDVNPFSIPRVVYLPGAKITVRKRKLKNSYGTWDESTSTITIDSQQTLEVQRYTLLHEIYHALVDQQHAGLMCGLLKAPKDETERA